MLFSRKNNTLLLILIFLTALAVRFLYFPNNIYFGFDQARDAYESQSIYKNLDLKLIGPSTADPKLFHGPLYWYMIGFIYLIARGDPSLPAAFLLVLNAVGVFLVYLLGKSLFNSKTGIIASVLYAFSFEQTQYAMYFGNPAPAVLSTLLFYLGLSLFIFKKDWRGLPLAFLGYGLSIQFEFFLLYLGVIAAIAILIFRKRIKSKVTLKHVLISLAVFILSISSFIVSDFKYGFRTSNTLLSSISKIEQGSGNIVISLRFYIDRLGLLFHDNVFPIKPSISKVSMIALIIFGALWVIRKKSNFSQVLFLLVWILSSLPLVLFGKPSLYYTNIGISAGLLIYSAFLLERLREKKFSTGIILVLLIILGNLSLITKQNPRGIINDIYVQEGMLLSREKAAIDYIYRESSGKPIVVASSTMPLFINTTWAYLFNWYADPKYGHLPYWAGKTAEGYPGSLPIWKSQEKDYQFFSIIEPTRGVGQGHIDLFLLEQGQYGEVVDEKSWGDRWYSQLVVQKRK